MPELPEVETVRRALEPALVGATIERAEVRRERMVRRQSHPGDFADRITGQAVIHLGRTGKFLMAGLTGDLTWVTHLGMSGHIRLAKPGETEDAHTNIVVRTDRDDEIRFVDPRTFGFMAVLTPDEMEESSLRHLGPDALTDLPRTARLAERLAGRSAPVKALLLDQRLVAGIGNIYADEILHRAGIRPGRAGGSLRPPEVAALRAAIKPVLRAGLRWGGTSLDDLAYLLPDGRAGEAMARLAVYGRDGDRCRRCGSTIVKAMLRGRSSHWCPGCQR